MLCHFKLLRCLFACRYTMLACLPGVALAPPASPQRLRSCLALQNTEQQQFLMLCWVVLPSQMLSNLLSRERTFAHRSVGSTGLFGLVFSLLLSFCWLAFVSSNRKLQSCDWITMQNHPKHSPKHVMLYTFKYAANIDSFLCELHNICSGCMNSRDPCPILYIFAENWKMLYIYFT